MNITYDRFFLKDDVLNLYPNIRQDKIEEAIDSMTLITMGVDLVILRTKNPNEVKVQTDALEKRAQSLIQQWHTETETETETETVH